MDSVTTKERDRIKALERENREGGFINEVRILYQNRTLHGIYLWDAAPLT